MSESLRGVVACHGTVAEALIGAVERITGIRDALVPVSNTDCDKGALEERIAQAAGDHPAVVFTDMASGSCLIAALTEARRHQAMQVVSGVNLAMLLDFVFHRDLEASAAAERAAGAGQRAIRVP